MGKCECIMVNSSGELVVQEGHNNTTYKVPFSVQVGSDNFIVVAWASLGSENGVVVRRAINGILSTVTAGHQYTDTYIPMSFSNGVLSIGNNYGSGTLFIYYRIYKLQ